jgi:fermentation-respiration switch protein FrsA (DUF1100 family)
LKASDGVELAAIWVRHPDPKSHPTALYLHGQVEDLDGAWARLQTVWDAGYNVLGLDYRGFGKSGGSPTEQGLVLDARAGLAAVCADARTDPDRVLIWAFSLGTAVAAQIAPGAQAALLVLEAPFSSFEDMVEDSSPFGPSASWVTEVRFDTLSRIGEVTMPVVVAMGAQDSSVPNRMSREVYQKVSSPKRLVVVEGAEREQVGPKGIAGEVRAIAELSPRASP